MERRLQTFACQHARFLRDEIQVWCQVGDLLQLRRLCKSDQHVAQWLERNNQLQRRAFIHTVNQLAKIAFNQSCLKQAQHVHLRANNRLIGTAHGEHETWEIEESATSQHPSR